MAEGSECKHSEPFPFPLNIAQEAKKSSTKK